ncbi:MAG: SDR family oxidoreductase [Ramlibacter sp.]|nr:SDR family oxidoreductase [Ramlibacter sp.]
MNSQNKRVAIVTGASRGIGRAIALRLARDGHSVAVNYADNAEKAAEVVAAIKAQGGDAIAIQGDVGRPQDVATLFDTARRHFGGIDVVVNSAGIMPMAAITPASLEAFDQVVNTNLRGSFLVMAQAAEQLPAGGRIIVFSSSVLAKAFPQYGPYIASKAAVEGLVHVLANELRGRNITVNAVAPGPVATELFLRGKSEQLIDQIARQAPLERIGQPEDIASAVSFLAGPDGGWVNAQVVRVNGGFA